MMKKLSYILAFTVLFTALFLLPCVTAHADAESESDGPILLDMYLGDVDGNGKVTASDARTILRHASRLETIDPDYFGLADVNGDNSIKAGDARIALRMATKLESLLTFREGYHVHQFNEEILREPTCSQPGEKLLTCSLCGREARESIPTTPHDFAPATLTAPKTCRVCGKTEGKTLAAQCKLTPEVKSLSMRKGGTAIVKIDASIPDEIEVTTISIKSSSSAVDAFWLEDQNDELTDYVIIYVNKATSGADVTVFLKEAPSVKATIRVTAGSSGTSKYAGTKEIRDVPDYGAFTGIDADYAVAMTGATRAFVFGYNYNTLKSAGYSDDTLFEKFDQQLKKAGFQPAGSVDGGGLSYAKNGKYVTFVYYVNDGYIEIGIYP